MLELYRTKVEVKIDGATHNLRLPTYKESIAYGKKIKAVEGEDERADLLMSYLDELGLPKAVTETLELDHIGQVLDFITGSKKK